MQKKNFGNMSREDKEELQKTLDEKEKILEVKNIEMSYHERGMFLPWKSKKRKVLNQVTFSIQRGEAYGLFGASGCGKSTLAKVIMGAMTPEAGEIWLDGTRTDRLPAKEQRIQYDKIQMIFQDSYSSLNPSMTAGRIVEEPMRNRRMYGKIEQKDRTEAVMERLGFAKSDLSRFPHEFSGGQRQKIALARTLVITPEVLVCDEPFASLDAVTKYRLLELLEKIHEKEKMSFLYISHDGMEVQKICSRAGIMKDGKIIEERRIR